MLRKIFIIIAIVLAGLTTILLTVFCVLYFRGSGDYTVPATTAYDSELPYIEIDGYRFHGETFGSQEGIVIIALHGGPGGDYRSILPLAGLADDYFVVFYDQRGSGLSPRVDKEELSLEQYLKDLDAIIEHFSTGRPVIIIGHSWGAMLASSYIGKYPEKVTKAVLAEPGFLNNEFMKIFYAKTGMADMKPTPEVLSAMAGAFGKSLHVNGPDGHERKDFFFNTFLTTPIEANPLSGYYPEGEIENAAGEYWRFGSLANSAVPASGMDEDGRLVNLAAGVEAWPGTALFISGSENLLIGPDYQRIQMKLFPQAELEVIEGAGHTMFGEKPVESLAVIRGYL